MNTHASGQDRSGATESDQANHVATEATLMHKVDSKWKYPPGALAPAECECGKLYRIQFQDDDWDFTIPGDSPAQDVPVYEARRTQTKFGIEWFVVDVERWTYKDDELIILGEVAVG
ncbi:hypothetical protein [Mycobacteroides abscessus]|jgi:hypothetical protein|uniref:hypothetical protein n=1 Tax=Mycobacteroides abscessus TaxID=36809 RepID=UPI0019D2CAEC|nr:hypothetical protein [Mycobacteroides abscessus]MBN7315032.1 hypothetical protein [Mycobacteroides abscessus subsp. abscessus]MDO3013307.1 hypothetical protein [Mycobacteroides abscessus subsp. abscessus]